jgi:hypothetical protein
MIKSDTSFRKSASGMQLNAILNAKKEKNLLQETDPSPYL